MKKVLSLILSLVMVLAALPLTVIESSAVTYTTSSDGLWKYYLDDNNNAVIDSGSTGVAAYLGNATDVTVPSYIDGNPVICLGSYAFYQRTAVKSVTVPEGVTNFGTFSFDGCTGLESINFPSTMYSINAYSFRGCTSLTSVDFGTSLQIINSNAFQNCTALSSITIPGSVTSIPSTAFNGCNAISECVVTYFLRLQRHQGNYYRCYYPRRRNKHTKLRIQKLHGCKKRVNLKHRHKYSKFCFLRLYRSFEHSNSGQRYNHRKLGIL